MSLSLLLSMSSMSSLSLSSLSLTCLLSFFLSFSLAFSFSLSLGPFLLLLGFVFGPFYLRSRVYTMPMFLHRRFDHRLRTALAFLSLLLYVLTKISVALYSGGVVLRALTGIDNLWMGPLSMLLLTGLYVSVGGMAAVIWTEVLQAVILVVGGVALAVLALHRVGGWQALNDRLPPSFFSMIRPIDDSHYPITGVILGFPPLSLW